LKKGADQPDEFTAARIGADSDALNSDYNVVPQEVLQAIPGVTAYNYRMIMRRVYCLKDLGDLLPAELQDWLNEKPARELYNFLHKDHRK